MDANKIQKLKERKKGNLAQLAGSDLNLDTAQLPKFIPFVLYLTMWAILYIANTHYSEKAKINIDRINKEIKELRADYLTISSELMYKSKQSEVSKMVAPLGLKELKSPPKKLTDKK